MEILGPDVVARVLRGGVLRRPRRPQRRLDHNWAGGSFRCGGTGLLTDQARAEMERKVRERETRERGGGAEWVED
jgi:hypothetical protein